MAARFSGTAARRSAPIDATAPRNPPRAAKISYLKIDRFLRISDEFFSGFRAKFQKRVTSVAFQSILRKQIRKLPKILKSVKIIQYYTDPNSILFNRVLSGASPAADSGAPRSARVREHSAPLRTFLETFLGSQLSVFWSVLGVLGSRDVYVGRVPSVSACFRPC